MTKKATFFLGRISKLGLIDNEKLINALSDGPRVSTKSYNWMVTDVKYVKSKKKEFLYGRLSKYLPDGENQIIDEDTKKTKEDIIKNLAIAGSSFVYIPKYSGFCYQRLYNKIDPESFKSRLRDIVISHYNNFFVDLVIQDISELYKFEEEIKKIDKIMKIKCTITQPNPLYGDIWAHLKEYLINRNSKKLKIEEEAKFSTGIKSSLIAPKSKDKINLADASIKMAIDGYGEGEIVGVCNGKEKIIRTQDSVIQFKEPEDIEPEELAEKATLLFEKISMDRGLKH